MWAELRRVPDNKFRKIILWTWGGKVVSRKQHGKQTPSYQCCYLRLWPKVILSVLNGPQCYVNKGHLKMSLYVSHLQMCLQFLCTIVVDFAKDAFYSWQSCNRLPFWHRRFPGSVTETSLFPNLFLYNMVGFILHENLHVWELKGESWIPNQQEKQHIRCCELWEKYQIRELISQWPHWRKLGSFRRPWRLCFLAENFPNHA